MIPKLENLVSSGVPTVSGADLSPGHEKVTRRQVVTFVLQNLETWATQPGGLLCVHHCASLMPSAGLSCSLPPAGPKIGGLDRYAACGAEHCRAKATFAGQTINSKSSTKLQRTFKCQWVAVSSYATSQGCLQYGSVGMACKHSGWAGENMARLINCVDTTKFCALASMYTDC